MAKNRFQPYVSADKTPRELTGTSIIVGVLLAIVFGAANAYLGLRVGLTVSASIPAAVVAMGVIRVVLRRNSIIESNVVQTIGSAGESLAAGAIFTLPALYLWASEGLMKKPSFWEITLISLIGGLLGVFFMVPLRKALIVREHATLPYPEGRACSEVLLAGENGASNTSVVFAGLGFSALFKLIIDGLKLVPGEINLRGSQKNYPATIGTQIYPAVLSVGYICGPRIASYMFAGGIISWVVLIPLIILFGGNMQLYPATETIENIFAVSGAEGIWSAYIRYIGAGALAMGGIISLIKSLPLIVQTFRDTFKGVSLNANASTIRTEQDIRLTKVLVAVLLLTLSIWLIPAIPATLFGAVIVVIFGFFFATVSSRMVGLVGSSNNPVSGMAIAALLIATLLLKLTGETGVAGMRAAIVIGSIICIVSAISGDTSQDLKTGYLLGATPKKQQIGEIVGVIAASLSIGVTLNLLDSAWGFGTEALAAPQATLMKMIVEGITNGNLPWGLILIGASLSVVIEILGIPVLPVAIGIYLPVQLNSCIMVGGVIRWFYNKIRDEKIKRQTVSNGMLFCSGMIAGEGLVGILLAILAATGIGAAFDLSDIIHLSTWSSIIASLGVFVLIILLMLFFTLFRKQK